MEVLWSAIAFLNWERNLAHAMGMTHGAMKDLVTKRVVKCGMNVEEANKAIKEYNATHSNR